MGFIIDLIPAPLRIWALGIAIAAALAGGTGGYLAFVHHQREIGREEVRKEWNADKLVRAAADEQQSELNADETARRLAAQQENQHAQDKELAAALAAADRNARERDQLRDQNITVARQWRAALGNSPTERQCAAAGDAIGVFADVLGRADRRAGVLAAYADAARAAGLKCERDYDALTAK